MCEVEGFNQAELSHRVSGCFTQFATTFEICCSSKSVENENLGDLIVWIKGRGYGIALDGEDRHPRHVRCEPRPARTVFNLLWCLGEVATPYAYKATCFPSYSPTCSYEDLVLRNV